MKEFPVLAVIALFALALPACRKAEEHHEAAHQSIIVTNPKEMDVTITQKYVCQVHSRRHIEVRALEGGYLEAIPVKEGQAVHQGDLMFRILPTLYQAKLASETAEAKLAQIEFNNTKRLFEQNVVSDKEVALAQAKLTKALAQVSLAQAELNFTEIKAPFDGIIDRLHEQQGSLIEEGDILTTLSDNEVMWVYFNVPEARYLEYKAGLDEQHEVADDYTDGVQQSEAANVVQIANLVPATPQGEVDTASAQVPNSADPAQSPDVDDDPGDEDDHDDDEEHLSTELMLANGNKFAHSGKIAAIEADFNNETGNIAFRADFPNPDALLRHGQTGTVLIHRKLDDALVIPQRSTFEILAKRYVYVVDAHNVVHQREIEIAHELEDVYVIDEGLEEDEKIVLEGVLQVREGAKAEYEFRDPESVLSNLKNKAE